MALPAFSFAQLPFIAVLRVPHFVPLLGLNQAGGPGHIHGPAGQGACVNISPPLCSREDAMRKAGVAHSKSSKDMESHVFLKAKTRVRPWGVAPSGDAAGGQGARPWGRGGCSLLGGILWEDPVFVV